MTESKRIAADTLGMEAAEMRRLGYKLVDMVVERHLHRNHEPAILTGQPQDLLAALGGEPPESPLDADESLELLAQVALAHQQHGDHPRYFARVPGPGSFAALLGEWLGVGFNTIAASWGGVWPCDSGNRRNRLAGAVAATTDPHGRCDSVRWLHRQSERFYGRTA